MGRRIFAAKQGAELLFNMNKRFDWPFFVTERFSIADAAEQGVSLWRRVLRRCTRGYSGHARLMQGVWGRRYLGLMSLVYSKTRLYRTTTALPMVISWLGKKKHPRRATGWGLAVGITDRGHDFEARKFRYLIAGVWDALSVHGDDYFDWRRSALRREVRYLWNPTKVSE